MEIVVKRPKYFKCLVTHITTTDKEVEIWCQTDHKIGSRVASAIDLNHKTLSDLFAIKSLNLCPILTPEVGKNYLTRIKNSLEFYRTVVTHVSPESSRAAVMLIDFGIEEWVPFNHLVEFEPLFGIKPLAQKFFLADIKTKEEWDSERVKPCLQPYLMSVFQCEVIGCTKNTECIRVYDSFFRQPFLQHLVNQCNGYLSYPEIGAQVYEAIDLTVDDEYPNKQIEDKQTNGFTKMNGFSESSSFRSTPTPPPNGSPLSPSTPPYVSTRSRRPDISTGNGSYVSPPVSTKCYSPHIRRINGQNLEEETTSANIKDVLPIIKKESEKISDQLEVEGNSNETVPKESQNIAAIEPIGTDDQLLAAIPEFKVKSPKVLAPEESNNTKTEVQMSEEKNCETRDSAPVKTHQLLTEAIETQSEVVAETTETKSEVVAETTETKSEVVTEAIETQSEVVAETTETKSEVVAETTETKSEVVTEAIETQSEVVAETTETKSEVVAETTETKSEVVTEIIETQSEVVTETIETQSEVVTETIETQSEVVTETTESKSEVMSEAKETPLEDRDKCVAIPQQIIAETEVAKEVEEKDCQQKPNVNEDQYCTDSIIVDNKLIGKSVKVYATAPIKEGSFYCQLAEEFEAITALIDKMTVFYNEIHDSDKNGLNFGEVKVGDIVAARFSEDQLWYRVSVKDKKENRLQLFYIDFGNEETVDVKQCKQLEPQFNLESMEPQALCCSVIGTTVPSVETIGKYILDMTEMECLFSHFKDNVYSVSLIFE